MGYGTQISLMPLASGETTSFRERFIQKDNELSDVVLSTVVIQCVSEKWSPGRIILNSQSRLLSSATCLNQGVRQDILLFSPKALT